MYDCRWHYRYLLFNQCTERLSKSHVVDFIASRCKEASLPAPAGWEGGASGRKNGELYQYDVSYLYFAIIILYSY